MAPPLYFALRVLAFATPVLLVAGVFEVAMRTIPHDFVVRRERLAANAAPIETLVLGSSHTYKGIDPSLLGGRAYSLAYLSQSYAEDLALLRAYEAELSSVRRIVLPLSYPSPYHRLAASPEDWRLNYYTAGYGLCPPRPRYALALTTWSPKQLAIRLWEHYRNDAPALRADAATGFILPEARTRAEDVGADAAGAVERHTYHPDADRRYLDDNRRDLRAILDWARERGAVVALVSVPTHASYYGRLDSTQLALARQIGREAGEQSHVGYLDAFSRADFGPGDFDDADHLSLQGARRFTPVVDSLLDALETRGARR